MTEIKSNYDAPLPFPIGGVVLQPGRSVNIDRWNVICEHETVKAWLSAGVIEVVVDNKPETEQPKSKGAKRATPASPTE